MLALVEFTGNKDSNYWETNTRENVTVQYLHGYEKTIKLGQIDKDGTLYDVTTITLYDGSYMGIKIYGLDDLDMIFAVSEDTANYLNRYLE